MRCMDRPANGGEIDVAAGTCLRLGERVPRRRTSESRNEPFGSWIRGPGRGPLDLSQCAAHRRQASRLRLMWWVQDPTRLKQEVAAVEALRDTSPWLTTAIPRPLQGLRFGFDFDVTVQGETYPFLLSYPALFPTALPQVIPRDGRRLSSHQYGDGGEMCLEVSRRQLGSSRHRRHDDRKHLPPAIGGESWHEPAGGSAVGPSNVTWPGPAGPGFSVLAYTQPARFHWHSAMPGPPPGLR